MAMNQLSKFGKSALRVGEKHVRPLIRLGKRKYSQEISQIPRHHQQQEQNYRGPSTIPHAEKMKMDALLEEMRRLKRLILENANDPSALCIIIRKETFNFDKKSTSATNDAEALRRIVWLIDKYLTADELHHFKLADVTLGLFENLSDYFLQTTMIRSIQEYADIMWTFAKMGCRPPKLIKQIVKKMDTQWEDCRPNELADLCYACGELQVSTTPLVMVLDNFVRKNEVEGTLHRFLPRDLAQIAYGYAMMDPVFHNYKFVWTLNNHLNKLGGHVPWTPTELTQILHYDVAMRWINKGWKLGLKGTMAKLCDENFIQSPKPTQPYIDPLWNEVSGKLEDLGVLEAFSYKNIEGYHLPFAFFGWNGSPLVLEPQGKIQFSRLDHGHNFLGGAMLRRNSLDAVIALIVEVPYFDWPEIDHLQIIKMREKLNSQGMFTGVRGQWWSHFMDPHYKKTRFRGHRTV